MAKRAGARTPPGRNKPLTQPVLRQAVAEGNVFYVAPEGKGYAIMGQIVDSDGRDLTAEVQQAVQEEQLKVLERYGYYTAHSVKSS